MQENGQKSISFIAWLFALVLFDVTALLTVPVLGRIWSDFDMPPASKQLSLLLFGVFAASTLLTYSCLFIFRRQIASGGKLFLVSLAVATALLFVTAMIIRPIGSVDNYWNTLMSRGWTQYGRNPYLTTPKDLGADPLFPYTAHEWRQTGMMYGPLWVLAAAVPTLALSGAAASVFGMKALVSAGYIAAGLLLFSLLRRRRNPQANLFLTAWLLNPVGLFEVANAGHNEGLVVLPLAVFAIGLIEKRPRLILPALTAAVLIKVWPACLLTAVLGIRGARRKEWLQGALIGAFMAVASFAFFWHGWDIFQPLFGRLNEINSRFFSPGYFLLTYASIGFTGGPLTRTAPVVRIVAAFALAAGAGLAGSWAARGKLSALSATKLIMMIFFFICLGWLQPWYLLGFLPFCLPAASENAEAGYLRMITAIGILSFASYIASWVTLTISAFIAFNLVLTSIYIVRVIKFLSVKASS
jgi:hypothetical protein